MNVRARTAGAQEDTRNYFIHMCICVCERERRSGGGVSPRVAQRSNYYQINVTPAARRRTCRSTDSRPPAVHASPYVGILHESQSAHPRRLPPTSGGTRLGRRTEGVGWLIDPFPLQRSPPNRIHVATVRARRTTPPSTSPTRRVIAAQHELRLLWLRSRVQHLRPRSRPRAKRCEASRLHSCSVHRPLHGSSHRNRVRRACSTVKPHRQMSTWLRRCKKR